MRRRKPLAALVALGLAGVAGFVLWPRPSATRENYDRIKAGMSRAEVEAIFGPPGDYRTTITFHEMDRQDPFGLGLPGESERDYWMTDEVRIRISFDSSGRVVGTNIGRAFSMPEDGTLDNLLWRAKSRWRKLRGEKPL
jgi:hypothetical protein